MRAAENVKTIGRELMMEKKNKQRPGVEKTWNKEAQREYEALESAIREGRPGKKSAAQRKKLAVEREAMQYPNEQSQLTDRMASNSWQG